MITDAQLIAAGIPPTQAEMFAPWLQKAAVAFHIDTPNEVALWLANITHESLKFTRLRENLYYSTAERVQKVFGRKRFPTLALASQYLRNPEKLANFVYANRLGNGDVASGDGWKFRGAGLIMLTGQANFMAAGAACGRPYKQLPHIVALPEDAAHTAAWFWVSAGCKAPAQAKDHLNVRRRVNGPAVLGLGDCVDWADKFLEVL
jgi:putative chitinase